MKRCTTLALLIMLLCFSTVSIGFAENMTVGFSGTDMRSKPNAMDSKVIAELAPYTPLSVIEKSLDYYKVKDYQGRTGWVHRSLLKNETGVVVTGDKANIRKGPGTNHPVIFQLSKGMPAKLLEKNDKWVHIQTSDGKNGWVADFLVWGD